MSYLEKGQIDKTMECALVYLNKLYVDMVKHRVKLRELYNLDLDVMTNEAKEDAYIDAQNSRISYYADAVNVVSCIAKQVYGDDLPTVLIFRDDDGKHSLKFFS